MNINKRKALEAAGYRVGDAEDFLGLTEGERDLVELRMKVAREIRHRREAQKLTQGQLAAKLSSSQSRVAKIEAAERGVSLDLMFRSFFAVGGRVEDLTQASAKRGRIAAKRSASSAAGTGLFLSSPGASKAKTGASKMKKRRGGSIVK